jgi:hypothetical protein
VEDLARAKVSESAKGEERTMSRGARIRIRPATREVLHPNGKPVKGVRLEGAKLIRLPEVAPAERAFLKDLALTASGKSSLSSDDLIELHDLRRRARRASQSPTEVWNELAEDMQERPQQTLDLTKSHLKAPIRQRPGRSIRGSASLTPDPPRGIVSVNARDNGVVRDRRGRKVDGVRFDFASSSFVRVPTLAEELSLLQFQEDEISKRQDSDAADEQASQGLASFGKRLLARLGQIADRPEPITAAAPAPVVHVQPPTVNVTVPAPVVHVQAPDVRVPDVHVTVEQPPRAASVRLEIADDGTRRFIAEDEEEE